VDQPKKTGKVEIEERTGKSAFPNAVTGTNDQYPFEELGMGQLLDGRIRGGVSGPCFFIPAPTNPTSAYSLLGSSTQTYSSSADERRSRSTESRSRLLRLEGPAAADQATVAAVVTEAT
jgi:hypothetical protein